MLRILLTFTSITIYDLKVTLPSFTKLILTPSSLYTLMPFSFFTTDSETRSMDAPKSIKVFSTKVSLIYTLIKITYASLLSKRTYVVIRGSATAILTTTSCYLLLSLGILYLKAVINILNAISFLINSDALTKSPKLIVRGIL